MKHFQMEEKSMYSLHSSKSSNSKFSIGSKTETDTVAFYFYYGKLENYLITRVLWRRRGAVSLSLTFNVGGSEFDSHCCPRTYEYCKSCCRSSEKVVGSLFKASPCLIKYSLAPWQR